MSRELLAFGGVDGADGADDDDIDARPVLTVIGAAPRAHTSGHPSNRPLHTEAQSGQEQLSELASIG